MIKAAASKRSLSALLAAPSKVAQALDWKKVSGSILSLAVHNDRLDLVIASHPSSDEEVTPLASIPLHCGVDERSNIKTLSPNIAQELSQIVSDFSVCGLVVSWPVQKEGWCGAPCGKVLFTLDQLMAANKTLLSKSRPMCLWDAEHNCLHEDEWGRAEVYSHASDKTEHLASQEQYQMPSTLAADVWNDFCRAHWPELYYQSHASEDRLSSKTTGNTSNSTVVDPNWLEDYEDTANYTRAAL